MSLPKLLITGKTPILGQVNSSMASYNGAFPPILKKGRFNNSSTKPRVILKSV